MAQLQLKVNYYYKNRLGEILKVIRYHLHDDWPYEAEFVDPTSDQETYENPDLTFTTFGGFSELYGDNEKGPVEELFTDQDLIEELTKEEYPELYL